MLNVLSLFGLFPHCQSQSSNEALSFFRGFGFRAIAALLRTDLEWLVSVGVSRVLGSRIQAGFAISIRR